MLFVVAALGALPALAEMGPRIGPDKKVVHYFQYWPDAAYCRANVRDMELLPFDGIAVWPTAEIDGEREKIWFRWFNPEIITEDLVADTIRDLNATTFSKFTDNFLQMSSQNDPLALPDWWDDSAWEKITANMALAARIARDCGLKGIMLDVEQYGPPERGRFNYGEAHAAEERLLEQGLIDRIHTWQEFADAARRRGCDIMAAMCDEYPGITLISIAGFHDLARRATDDWERDGLPASYYALLAPFADGLMEGAACEASLIDGAERTYAYKYNSNFVECRSDIKNAFALSVVPQLYKNRMGVAFGLMLDYGYHSHGWHTEPEDWHRNHFTPVDIGNALHFAMLNSDRYVWVYSELDGAVFLENVYGYWQDPAEHAEPTVPEEYLVELGRAREPRAVWAWSDGFETYQDGLLAVSPWNEGDPGDGAGQVVTSGVGFEGKAMVGTGLGHVWRAAHPDAVLTARLYSELADYSRYYVGFHTETSRDNHGFPDNDAVVIYLAYHSDGAWLSFESYNYDAGTYVSHAATYTGQDAGILGATWYDVRITLNNDDTVSGEYKLTTSDTWLPIGDGLLPIMDPANFAPNFVGIAGQNSGRVDDIVNGIPPSGMLILMQ